MALAEVDTVVRVDSVQKVFPTSDGRMHQAVRNVSFDVKRGEIVCVVGKTGCGKSTMVNMLLGLLRPTSGNIVVDGVCPSDGFFELREKIAAVFQTDRLLPWRTVVDNAALGLEAKGVEPAERRRRAAVWLEKVGLGRWADAHPHQLSGGMRQRVAIARAFVLDPSIILLDEAFGHLDEVTANELRTDCLSLVSELGKAVLMVTHNITEALEVGDRLVVLGRPSQVLGIYDLKRERAESDWEHRMPELRQEIFRVIDSGSAALDVVEAH